MVPVPAAHRTCVVSSTTLRGFRVFFTGPLIVSQIGHSKTYLMHVITAMMAASSGKTHPRLTSYDWPVTLLPPPSRKIKISPENI